MQEKSSGISSADKCSLWDCTARCGNCKHCIALMNYLGVRGKNISTLLKNSPYDEMFQFILSVHFVLTFCTLTWLKYYEVELWHRLHDTNASAIPESNLRNSQIIHVYRIPVDICFSCSCDLIGQLKSSR